MLNFSHLRSLWNFNIDFSNFCIISANKRIIYMSLNRLAFILFIVVDFKVWISICIKPDYTSWYHLKYAVVSGKVAQFRVAQTDWWPQQQWHILFLIVFFFFKNWGDHPASFFPFLIFFLIFANFWVFFFSFQPKSL